MRTERFYFIDVLRAMSILCVIAIHVYSQNLNTQLNNQIWNYLQFAVPPFIFCSGYVLFARYKDKITSWASVLDFYRKRLLRLLIPFYIYLAIHYGLVFLFPKYFNGFGIQFNLVYFLKSIFLIGGVNINWLPLLFLELAILFPFLVFAFSKKIPMYIYLTFSFIITAIFTIQNFPYDYYRYVMWIPWSLIFVLSFYVFMLFSSNKSSKLLFYYASMMAISIVVYLTLFVSLKNINKSIALYNNKYPPNLFYLSYGAWIGVILTFISRLKFWENKSIKNFILFISVSSYSLFFIHWIVLDFFTRTVQKLYQLPTIIELITLIIISISIQFTLNNLRQIKIGL